MLCEPERPAFFGDAPMSLNDALGQTKRWCVGLYEVGFSRYCPLTFGAKNASFLVGLCYAYYSFWGLWSISITIYALLPQLALINHIPLFPKVLLLFIYLLIYTGFDTTIYIKLIISFDTIYILTIDLRPMVLPVRVSLHHNVCSRTH